MGDSRPGPPAPRPSAEAGSPRLRSPWLVRRERRPHAAARLYCFPHAGGSAGEYVRWSGHLPAFEVWGIQPPGRGSRLAEAPITRIDRFVEALLGSATFDPPFTFFGHSLGALVAFEVARALRAEAQPQPIRLFLSGCTSPQTPRKAPFVHLLPDEDLLAEAERQGGALPPQLYEEADLLALMLRRLRADLELFETYDYVSSEPLECPITVLCGTEDHHVRAHLEGWQAQTRDPLEVRLVPGGHFYSRDRPDQVFEALNEGVAAAPDQ